MGGHGRVMLDLAGRIFHEGRAAMNYEIAFTLYVGISDMQRVVQCVSGPA